ncbi:HNH endonuclease [Pseudomonas sp. TH34]|uniref:HNH endonuclease n=1 Tax=Pseudomonas sp. TH34 TaxID=2796399 RepID=UPI0019138BFB|nr:HNH endonuclease [Pseudomonas sp. TH34]MBK5411546.1 HNH endonuclease [Pseudomonas sp. TH34]
MAFDRKIVELIAYRSAYICNNPECNTLTIGPSTTDINLKYKLGEAAHIIGEKNGAARNESIDSHSLGDIENAIWLCANCHTLIDKNKGADYPKETLYSWKEAHEEIISGLLRTHKSPLPLLRKQTENFQLAQALADEISSKGVFYIDGVYENYKFVIQSLDELRKFIGRESKKIQLDSELKKIFTALGKISQEVMNENSNDYKALDDYLRVMRRKAGVQLKLLQEKYGCVITGPITTIM